LGAISLVITCCVVSISVFFVPAIVGQIGSKWFVDAFIFLIALF
jgi:hypothetical protein